MPLQEEFENQGNWLFRYRSYLPLIILVVALGLHIRTEMNPHLFFLEDTPYEIYFETGALLVSLIGLVIRVYTVGYTPKNTSGRNTEEGQVADSLNSTGIYSMVRHPLYLGNFLMWLGPALLPGNIWFVIIFCLFYWLYYERIMFAEEQFLRRKFGRNYLEWASGVPAFFPSFRKFEKAKFPFSWKKVLRKEKNGLFALFLIFCLFNLIGEWAEGDNGFNYFLILMCLLTGLTYLVLKVMKYKTGLLEEEQH